jgi:hypothetical protein
MLREGITLGEFEQCALDIRHRAAVEVLNSPMCPEGWKILAEIVAPSEPVRLASERRARELLERSGLAEQLPDGRWRSTEKARQDGLAAFADGAKVAT